jgi:hypothetical protein
MTHTSSIRAEQPVPPTLGSAQSAPQNRRKFGTLGTTQGFLEVQIPLSPPSPGLPGFSSTFSEIAPTARVPRDLKDSGELAVEVS